MPYKNNALKKYYESPAEFPSDGDAVAAKTVTPQKNDRAASLPSLKRHRRTGTAGRIVVSFPKVVVGGVQKNADTAADPLPGSSRPAAGK